MIVTQLGTYRKMRQRQAFKSKYWHHLLRKRMKLMRAMEVSQLIQLILMILRMRMKRRIRSTKQESKIKLLTPQKILTTNQHHLMMEKAVLHLVEAVAALDPTTVAKVTRQRRNFN